MKKKIFFLINSLESGGAERVVTNIAEKLSNKFDITLITLKDVKFYELSENIKYISLSKIKNNLLMFLLIPFYVYKFKKILQKEKFDTGISFLEIANFINILSNKNAIISFRTNIIFFKGVIGFFYKIFIHLLYPKSKKILVNSEENKYDLVNYLNLDLDKIDIIYNPIDLDKIKKLKKEKIEDEILNKIKGKKVFITVGRLVGQKYHEKILNSFSKIKDKNWVYLIVGDGKERLKLENLVKNLGIQENIIFLGAQKNVFKYLHISNYFVYASKVEGFPNVLIEAMACNLPIITSDFISGAKECIMGNYDNNLKNIKYPYYGDNGVLLDLKNYEENFINVYNNLDKLRQNKVGFERFDIENVKESFEKIFS